MGSWGIVLWLIGLSAMIFFSVAWLLDLNNRQRQIQGQWGQLFTDSEGQDLSQPLQALTARLDANDERAERLQSDMGDYVACLPRSIQAVGLVRFKAFSDFGGDQSFALALTNPAGDGVIISSIFAREGTRVYAKPLKDWTSSYSLSFEEEEAILQAQSQIQKEG
jgi:hypothetical protein